MMMLFDGFVQGIGVAAIPLCSSSAAKLEGNQPILVESTARIV